MLEISLNMYHAVALGAFLFWLGGVITSKISLLNRYCIPAPLVGGLCFSIVNCILSIPRELPPLPLTTPFRASL